MRIVAEDFPQGLRFSTAPVFSSTARKLQEQLEGIVAHLSAPVSAYGMQWHLHREIDRVAAECAEDNWDDEGAARVTTATVDYAKAVASALPPGLTVPTTEGGAAGEIMFEWRAGRRLVLLLSVYPDNTIGFAAVRGLARHHGREPFTGVLSEFVSTLLRQLAVR